MMSTLKTFSVWMFGALAILGSQTTLGAEEKTVEEIVVTGSYLKQTAADSPSPLSVVTSAEIEDLGAVDVSEIVDTLPWQSGSQVRATTFGGEGADGRNSVNLRNLGHGATLVLVNGKRQVASWYNPRGEASVNVNGLIPNIAIERIEIVKDGSSALYGSDAIAGVVNFITKKDFEGFQIGYQGDTDEETQDGTSHDHRSHARREWRPRPPGRVSLVAAAQRNHDRRPLRSIRRLDGLDDRTARTDPTAQPRDTDYMGCEWPQPGSARRRSRR